MRKVILGGTIGIALTLSFAFVAANYEFNKSTAEVDQVEGVYIFINAKPVNEYKYLGTSKSFMTLGSGQFQDVRDKLIRKVKKKYPEADGIIFSFYDGGTDKCDAIKFK